MVAPGGHMQGLMQGGLLLDQEHGTLRIVIDYFSMSGTSQATAVTGGIVALMLEADPSLTPDDVKCHLMASAHTAQDENGDLAYSIFQQGAGLVNAYDAVHNTETGCANQGIDVDLDLADVEHYGGRAKQDPTTGEYCIMDLDGYAWGEACAWGAATMGINTWVPQE
jgi:subtilisin family serine protease